MALVLHYHPLASYCWKSLIALYETGAAFDRQVVDLGDAGQLAAFVALWPTGKMPLLIDDGRIIPESSIIAEYLDRRRPGTLLPAGADAQLSARLWDRLFDTYVMNPMQEIVADHFRPAAGKHADSTAQARATLAMAYAMIETQMARHDWAAGPAFSMADCAAFPALFYARTLEPFPASLTHLPAYFERLLARLSIKRTLEDAQPYFAMYPFRSAIEPRFLSHST